MTTMTIKGALVSKQVGNIIQQLEAGQYYRFVDLYRLLQAAQEELGEEELIMLKQRVSTLEALQPAAANAAKKKVLPASTNNREANPLSVAKAARVLEKRMHKPAVANTVRGIYKAVASRDQESLVNILDAISGLRTYGPLRRTLEGIAEHSVGILLEIMLEQKNSAKKLLAQAKNSHGLSRAGLMNRAFAANKASKVVFIPRAGLAAIERMVREDRLPETVSKLFSKAEKEQFKKTQKPATALLAHIRTIII